MEHASSKSKPGKSFMVFCDSRAALKRQTKATDNSRQARLIKILTTYQKLKEKGSRLDLSGYQDILT